MGEREVGKRYSAGPEPVLPIAGMEPRAKSATTTPLSRRSETITRPPVSSRAPRIRVKSTGNMRTGLESSRMAGDCAAVRKAKRIAIIVCEKATTGASPATVRVGTGPGTGDLCAGTNAKGRPSSGAGPSLYHRGQTGVRTGSDPGLTLL